MKLKELVELVNQKIEEKEFNKVENQMYYDECAYKVGSLIKEIFTEKNIEATFSSYSRKSELELFFSKYNKSLFIKIKRKKGETHYNWGFGSTTQYYIDRIEIQDVDLEKTFEELFEEWAEINSEMAEAKKENVNKVVEAIEATGLTFEEFDKLVYEFKYYRYDIKEQMTGSRW